MAPKPSIVVNTPTEEAVKDSDGLPWLDGDDMHVPLFLALLDRHLQSDHPHLYAFIENNFTVDRSYTIVWTAEQASCRYCCRPRAGSLLQGSADASAAHDNRAA